MAVSKTAISCTICSMRIFGSCVEACIKTCAVRVRKYRYGTPYMYFCRRRNPASISVFNLRSQVRWLENPARVFKCLESVTRQRFTSRNTRKSRSTSLKLLMRCLLGWVWGIRGMGYLIWGIPLFLFVLLFFLNLFIFYFFTLLYIILYIYFYLYYYLFMLCSTAC